MSQHIHQCIRCLYDASVPKIIFDAKGVCSYCKLHDDLDREYPLGREGERRLLDLIEGMKRAGRRSRYDCVVGVSGGCDSSYLLYRMKEYGLRPLAVHFDNTWNSTIATTNIRKITQALDIDLYTYVVNNKEYDDIYRSFMKAGVPDIEAPTDIGLATTLYLAAEKYHVKFIVEGHSFRTEGISPLGWLYMDGKYIASVQKTYGRYPLETFPNLWLTRQLRWMIISRIKKVRPLYFVDYQKEQAKKRLTESFGWQWYGGHHLENRFTAFYHSYFIPRRFGKDFRVLGYSALIRSGQMSREEGLKLLETPPYDAPEVQEIVELVKKRLGLEDQEFERIMAGPKRTYRDFATYKTTFERLKPFFWLMYKMDLVPKSFYVKFTSRDQS